MLKDFVTSEERVPKRITKINFMKNSAIVISICFIFVCDFNAAFNLLGV